MKKTMKSFALVIAMLLGVNAAHSQAFDEGTKVFSLGYGFPNFTKSVFKALSSSSVDGSTKVTGAGPIHFRFEYGLSETWGIGASINFANAAWEDTYTGTFFNPNGVNETKTYTDKWARRALSALVRFNKHFPISDKADVYSGIGLGYNSVKNTYTSTNPDGVQFDLNNKILPIGFEWTVGLRFYFTDNIGAYVEGGFAKSILQFGLAIKLD
jgi:opacity protein-like surface antigen